MTHIPIAITGPTASGKSALAVELAIRLGGEVVSCDSMQIYKGMDIGTAKPAKEEMRGVPHHMIDIVSAGQLYSACDYARDAEIAVSDIQGRGKIPVFCGGTGLYLESYMYGASPEASPDNEYREELMGFHKEKGAQALHALLAEKDPIAAASIHPNNTKRVIRALEIIKTTGKTKTESDEERRQRVKNPVFVIGLRFADRHILYGRINDRVDKMLCLGLTEEARELYERGLLTNESTAGQAIGYKELLPYLKGEVSLAEAAENIKTATRRYAKRQITWFSAKSYIRWITADEAATEIEAENSDNNEYKNKNGKEKTPALVSLADRAEELIGAAGIK